MQILIREMIEEDKNFVRLTWLDHQSAQKYYRKCPRRLIKQHLGAVVQHHIETAKVLVAHPEGEVNQILGYIVFDDECLHFSYVKMLYRHFGIFTKMIENLPSTLDSYSSITDDKFFHEFIKKRRLIFNPWG